MFRLQVIIVVQCGIFQGGKHTDHRTTIYVGRMCHENDPLDILCLNLNKCPACRQVICSLFEAPVLGLSIAYLM